MSEASSREIVEHRRDRSGGPIPPEASEDIEVAVPPALLVTVELEAAWDIEPTAALGDVGQPLKIDLGDRDSLVIRIFRMLGVVRRRFREVGNGIADGYVTRAIQSRTREMKSRSEVAPSSYYKCAPSH